MPVPTPELQAAFEHCRDMDGPINARLASYAAALQAINPDFAEAVERLIVRLRANDCGDGAPRVGDIMPDFALPDDGGRIVRLDQLLSTGPTAIACTSPPRRVLAPATARLCHVAVDSGSACWACSTTV